MRYVFLAMLLANLGFIAWQYLREPTPAESVTRGSRDLPEDVDTIRLLEEQQRNNRQSQLDQVVRSPVTEPADSAADCLAVGPFQDLFSGQDVVDRLASLDIETGLRAVDRNTGESDYRVMIPPASSLENAFRKLRELQARDIDSYVITQGPDALAISLGVFSTRESAEGARDSRIKEGYEVTINEIQRLHREYWILSGETVDLEIPEALWEQLLERYPNLEEREMSCVFSGETD